MKRKQKPLTECPLRMCRTMHVCCLCAHAIRKGYSYYDGGYGRRAHVHCAKEEHLQREEEDGFCPNCGYPVCERCGICSMCRYEFEGD